MGVKFKNNAESTLAGGINGSVTTLDLAVGEGNNFPIVTAGPTDYFYCTIVDVSGNREIIKVTEHQSGDTFQTIERGADDTSGLSFIIGDKVQLRLPKIVLEGFRDGIATLDTYFAGSANPTTVPAPSGTKMFFYTDTLPATWTIDVGPADALLGIKGGAQAFNAAGGQVVGSWTPTTHTHTGPSHTHTGPNHIHTMPSHTHTGPSHTHTGPSHTHTMGTHNHMWFDYTGGTPSNTFNSGGTSVAMNQTGSGSSIRIKASDARLGADSYTNNIDPGDTNAGGTGATGAGGTGATGSTDPGNTEFSGTGATGADGTGATGTGSAPSTDRPQTAIGTMGTKD